MAGVGTRKKPTEESADEAISRRISSEAAIGAGGGLAAAFKAEQMRNMKAAELERRSNSTSKPNTSVTAPKPNTGLTTTKPNTGLTTKPNTGLTTKPNTRLTKPTANTSLVEDRPMRNVTPRTGAGAGIGSVVAKGLVVNPVVATAAALLASTGMANQGSETRNAIREIEDEFRAEQEKDKADFVGRLSDEFKKPMPEMSTEGLDRPEPTVGEPKQEEQYPKARIVPEEPAADNTALSLFNRTHGSDFDPKSSMDKKKMAAITALLAQEGSDKLTPNQFALRIYRTTK